MGTEKKTLWRIKDGFLFVGTNMAINIEKIKFLKISNTLYLDKFIVLACLDGDNIMYGGVELTEPSTDQEGIIFEMKVIVMLIHEWKIRNLNYHIDTNKEG